MNLEKIVRPFQQTSFLQTQRIIKSAAQPTGERAFLSWGAAGTVPKGVMQFSGKPSSTESFVGFKIVDAEKTYTQTDPPVTEDVDLNGVTLKRVREITFRTIADAQNAPASAANDAVLSDLVGLVKVLDASRETAATYKTTWD